MNITRTIDHHEGQLHTNVNLMDHLRKYLQVGAIAAAFAMPMDADAHMDHQDPTEIKTEAQSRPSDKLVSTGDVAQDIQNLKDKYAQKTARLSERSAQGVIRNNLPGELLGMVVKADTFYRTNPALQAYIDELRTTYGSTKHIEMVQDLINSGNELVQSQVAVANAKARYDDLVEVANFVGVKVNK